MAVTEIRRLLQQLKAAGVGVLVSDYDLHDLYEVMDRAYVLHEGVIVFSGGREELLSDPEVRRLYLGEGYSL